MKWFGMGLGFHINVPLGSGYNVQKDIDQRRIQLRRICDLVVANPVLAPRDGVTHCNTGVQMICEAMGVAFFHDEMANQMYDLMDASPKWRWDSGSRAHLHANNGCVALAARKHEGHGHIACVYPAAEMGFSGSLNRKVPFLANIGKENKICKASEAFPVAEGEPDYFLYVG